MSESTEGQAGTGSGPTDAKHQMDALLTQTLLEVARRRQDELPGLVEVVQDQVLLTSGGTARGAYGWYAEGIWRLDSSPAHEIFVNADQRLFEPHPDPAERLLTTLLHEASHAWAHANGIRDTSRDGRYHNRRFAEIALQIGLEVERDKAVGHRTPGLSARAHTEYSDLLTRLRQAPALTREPQHSAKTEATKKYVFASCICPAGHGKVTIRVAAGSWRPGAIRCHECGISFVAAGSLQAFLRRAPRVEPAADRPVSNQPNL